MTSIIALPSDAHPKLLPGVLTVVMVFDSKGSYDSFVAALAEARKTEGRRYQETISKYPELAGGVALE